MTEVDPDGIGQHDAGAKLDKGKVRAGLLEDFSLALMAVAEVLEYGASHYSPGGWQEVKDGAERYRHAAWRHLLARKHEKIDVDSGLPHTSQAIWNLLASLELTLRKERDDDKSSRKSNGSRSGVEEQTT